jgi:DNA gyrase subunit B
MVKVREGNTEWATYFPSDTEVRAFHEENRDLNLFDEPAPEPAMPEGEVSLENSAPAAPSGAKAKKEKVDPMFRRRARLVELHESATVQKLIDELARKGLKIEHYADSDAPIFEMIEGEGDKATTHPLFTIPEILQKVLEIGKKGLSIQRFKGLGEMNPKQLFETTMNPDKRKMMKVSSTSAPHCKPKNKAAPKCAEPGKLRVCSLRCSATRRAAQAATAGQGIFAESLVVRRAAPGEPSSSNVPTVRNR